MLSVEIYFYLLLLAPWVNCPWFHELRLENSLHVSHNVYNPFEISLFSIIFNDDVIIDFWVNYKIETVGCFNW